jgi:hypothetical protein
MSLSTWNGIEIINIDTKKTERRINTDQCCCGITNHKGVVLWCEVKSGIQMMTLFEDRSTNLVKQISLPSSLLRICRPCLPSGSSTTTLLDLDDVT